MKLHERLDMDSNLQLYVVSSLTNHAIFLGKSLPLPNDQKNWKKNCHMTHPNHSMDPSLDKRRPACSCTQFFKAGGHEAFLGFSHLEVWDCRVINCYIFWGMWDIFEGKNTSRIAKQVFTNSSGRLPVQTNQGDLFKGVRCDALEKLALQYVTY